MPEAVRLVIWDLDETFWSGTLSEGGVDATSHHGEIVRELNRRGIMNSICSKNDFENTKKFLEEIDMWDQFIFPSIDWTPKGHRVKEIVRKVQLRPETIMFIDDNSMNLGEVLNAIPAIQVADENFIGEILDSDLFKGKPDPNLTRLANYRIMEAKEGALIKADGDNFKFLRESNITVEIDYDLEKNKDRAIELINRTNQLNFTKKRLSDDLEVARTQFSEMISGGLFNHIGLVRVRDKFGDYGIIGFFFQIRHSNANDLIHFCFSCRTLGMHVETWLYQQLARPNLHIEGEVANNPITDSASVDWIRWYDPENSQGAGEAQDNLEHRPPIIMSGGCESESIQHYLENVTNDFRLFSGTVRSGFIVRRDHSTMVRTAVEKNEAVKDQLYKVGYRPEDFSVSFDGVRNGMVILSFWADINFDIHKLSWLDAFAPYSPPGVGSGNFQEFAMDDFFHRGGTEEFKENFQFAKSHLKPYGKIASDQFKENIRKIISNIDRSNKVLLLLPAINIPDFYPEWKVMDQIRLKIMCQIEVAREFDNVECVDFGQFIHDSSEVETYDHFKRIVYQRCGQNIREKFLQHCSRENA